MNKDFNSSNPFPKGSLSRSKDIALDANDMIYELLFTDKKDVYNKTTLAYKEIFERLGGENIIQMRRKKIIMSIVIELLDNMHKHGEIAQEHEATFRFYEKKDSLFFETTNYTKKENIEHLQEKTDKTSTNDLKTIKNAFNDQVLNGKISEVGGGGNGVFTIVKLLKNGYPELDTKDIFQKHITGLNGIRKVEVKVTMPNKNPQPKENSKTTNITQEDYEN
ncbi:hypothetical protein P148_SR1C00001G0136 [candidate division SR1 bacterium RAAC1_SR1_1]|nr:hypothetical protein P148_SR1C00001G0136 [candidate division SR1 bacterium RAAC1_SR1_1]